MEFRQYKTDLVREGLMPEDSQVVSTNNKLVAISPEQGVVYRVSKAAGSNLGDDLTTWGILIGYLGMPPRRLP
jgi:hypothetical protein